MNISYKIIAILCFIFLLYSLYNIYNKKVYISKSRINGQGLFAGQSFHKDDIIIDNIFPHKDIHKKIYNPIHSKSFKRYISIEGSKINHCSKSDNSYVYTSDNKVYQLIANKYISKGSEITSNYDKVHKKFPFIGGANKNYNLC